MINWTDDRIEAPPALKREPTALELAHERISELEQRLGERTIERDYQMRLAERLCARIRELEAR